jgi:hypothetical protein
VIGALIAGIVGSALSTFTVLSWANRTSVWWIQILTLNNQCCMIECLWISKILWIKRVQFFENYLVWCRQVITISLLEKPTGCNYNI